MAAGFLCLEAELEPAPVNLQVAAEQHVGGRIEKVGAAEGAVSRAGAGRVEATVEVTGERVDEECDEECDEEVVVQSPDMSSDEQDEGGHVDERDDEAEVLQLLELVESIVEE